jgi:hypothetical protein
MYRITVYKYNSERRAEEIASKRVVLVDHLEASAARHGFEITCDEPGVEGSLWKDGREVAGWTINKIGA